MKRLFLVSMILISVLALTVTATSWWWVYHPGNVGVNPGPHTSVLTKHVTVTVPEYFTVLVTSNRFVHSGATYSFGTMGPNSSKQVNDVFDLVINANVPWQFSALHWGSFAGQYIGASNWTVPSGYRHYPVNVDDTFKVRFRDNRTWTNPTYRNWHTAMNSFWIARPPLHYTGTAHAPGLYNYGGATQWRLLDPTIGYKVMMDLYLQIGWNNLPANYKKTIQFQISWHL